MPIPSLYDIGREEGRKAGREEGREQGREQLVESLLRARFDGDDRISAIAVELAKLSPAESIRRIERAGSLDDLV